MRSKQDEEEEEDRVAFHGSWTVVRRVYERRDKRLKRSVVDGGMEIGSGEERREGWNERRYRVRGIAGLHAPWLY